MSDDLVQRLRDYPSYEECLQAADRIEALEIELNDMSDFGKARHDEIVMANKRIKALEGRWELYRGDLTSLNTDVDMWRGECEEKDKRILELEAALRGIETYANGCGIPIDILNIARRALEGKHER